MNKKFALYALPIFAAVAILGVGLVSADDTGGEGFMHGWFKNVGEDKPSQEEMMAKKDPSRPNLLSMLVVPIL